ncbi:hypothetical protein ACH5RR_038794 [Cinchona calisaya]|uniref:Protein kinase domain-containing protein n=1 Tax=Cinchona calisaya TaxID=153742 RepID=A0ABD2XWB6_9GENT
MDNRITQDIECFESGSHTGLVIGPILLVLIVIGTYQIYRAKKLRKEDQQKIEQFFEDYKALKPTRDFYADIKRLTANFSNKVGQGGYAIVYKGKLSNKVSVAVKVLDNTKGDGEDFINDIGTIGQIHHVNVVRLVGYCADGFRRVLVYEFLPNHSLEKFTSSKNDANLLGPQLQPKDFRQLCSKEQSAVSMIAARGTLGYIAPEVFSKNFGKVSCKSDVYSFGMVLLEWMEKGEDITIEIENEDDSLITRKLMIVGPWCIQWYPVDRPSMKVVIQMLEAKEIPTMPRNPFGSEYRTGVVKKIATVFRGGSELTSISAESEE